MSVDLVFYLESSGERCEQTGQESDASAEQPVGGHCLNQDLRMGVTLDSEYWEKNQAASPWGEREELYLTGCWRSQPSRTELAPFTCLGLQRPKVTHDGSL